MIARKAGVGAGTIYIYFENKDALINEIYLELEKKMKLAIKEGYPASQSIRERFMHIWISLLRYVIEKPLHFRYIEQYHNSPYGTLRRNRILSRAEDPSIFMDLMKEGIAKHAVKDLPMVMLMSLAFGPMALLARDHSLGLIKLENTHIMQAAAACWEAIENK